MTTISVYLDDGRVFEYQVSGAMKAREHAAAIISSGYRHPDGADLEWYPPHRIVKVKAVGACESSHYTDTTRAT
jgi:hypothetical protein